MVSKRNIKRRLENALRGRRVVEGITLDSQNTRRMDDGFNLTRHDDGWTLEFSVADVAAMVAKGDALDQMVREAAENNRRYIFPDSFSVEAASLQKGKLRPAITFTMQFDNDFELQDYKLERTAFRSLKKYARENLEHNLPKETLAEWYDFIGGISTRRKGQLQGALTRNFNHCAGVSARPFVAENTCDIETGCADIIAEMTVLTSRVAADYMRKNDLPAYYRISGDLRTEVLNDEDLSPALKTWMDDILTDLTQSVDIAHMLSVDVTTPIRRYDNLIMQRILGAHIDGEDLPYTLDELRDLKSFCRWAQKNPQAVKLDFNDIVRRPDPMDDHPELAGEGHVNAVQTLHNFVHKAGFDLRSVSGRIHMLNFSFSVEAFALRQGNGSFDLKAVGASTESGEARSDAAAGLLDRIKENMPQFG